MPPLTPPFDSTPPMPNCSGAAIRQRPTAVRYGVLSLAIVMAMIMYLDRAALSAVASGVQVDLGLELDQMGDALAAFYWFYALFQVPCGWIGDRWGGRRALTAFVVAWSLAMAGLGMAGGLLSLVIMRALLGIGQAGAYATTASFLRHWMPFGQRGFANSAVSLGGRAGGLLAPALTPLLVMCLASWGHSDEPWRPVFLAYSLVGISWAVLFWLWFRDTPSTQPRCNAAEVALIEPHLDNQPSAPAATSGTIPLGAIFRSPGLQMLGLINFCVNVGWVFLSAWMPTYLTQVHGKSLVEAGLYTSLTAGAGMAGCLSGGLATDALVKRIGLLWGRRIPGMISYGGAALGLAACGMSDDADAIVVLLTISSFLGDFALGAMWATYQDIGGPFAGTALGWANMCGNIGAACATSLIGRLAQNYGWSATFVMSSSAYLIGALSWLLVDPRVPLRVDHRYESSTSGSG